MFWMNSVWGHFFFSCVSASSSWAMNDCCATWRVWHLSAAWTSLLDWPLNLVFVSVVDGAETLHEASDCWPSRRSLVYVWALHGGCYCFEDFVCSLRREDVQGHSPHISSSESETFASDCRGTTFSLSPPSFIRQLTRLAISLLVSRDFLTWTNWSQTHDFLIRLSFQWCSFDFTNMPFRHFFVSCCDNWMKKKYRDLIPRPGGNEDYLEFVSDSKMN